jgi:hypothetical protein
MADCNKLYAGYYYKGPGAISSTTIKSCDEGYWCNTEDVAIAVPATTPANAAGGRNPCPVGSSSTAGVYPAAGPSLEIQCTRLLAGFEYAGTADISATTIATCGADTYCAGERAIVNGGSAVLGTPCPEGTGVAKKGTDDEAGATSANDCIKLYEGYYYTGVGTAISRTTVLPCTANNFCPGYPNVAVDIVRGKPSLPTSCPFGTKVVAGEAYTTDALFFAANQDAREATAVPASPAANSGAKLGGRNTNNCDTLRDGYWYNGAGDITTATVKQCTADYFCNTEDLPITKDTPTGPGTGGASGYNPCPAGVNSLVGSDNVNDCNILEPGYFYDGPGAVSTTTVKTCPAKSYCTGSAIIDITADEVGRTACPAGATTTGGTATGKSASADCSDLLAGWYYTANGAITADTVLACPANSFCPGATGGVAAITVKTDKADQGRTACPDGSGSAGSSTSRDACTIIFKGYYFLSDNTCGSGIQDAASATCTYKVCDDPNQNAFCPGGTVTDVKLTTGRTACNFGTRTFCDVNAPGTDCVKSDDCISP